LQHDYYTDIITFDESEGDRGQGRDGFDSHGDSPVDEENAS